jgi:hypothetical protein
MTIEKNIPLLEEILGEWRVPLGDDFAGYRNHVYRMVNFCFAQEGGSGAEEREKIVIAGCFHDLGIWSDKTFDYLPPSIARAKEYLQKTGREALISEIESMIAMHHKLRRYEAPQNALTEVFRKGDLVDFSLGIVRCGVPKNYIKSVKTEFPNRGFHKCLARLAGRWIFRHPLNPVPVLKW